MREASAYRDVIDSKWGTNALALSLMLFMSMNSIAMSHMPIVRTGLEDRFSFSSSQIGFLTSIFMLTFAIAAIPMGLAAARWGGRTILGGAALYAVGSLLFALSASYPWFLAARFLQGLGGSTFIPTANLLMAQAITPRYHARALGFFGLGHGLGVVSALLIMPSIEGAGGYRAVSLATTAIAVVVMLVAVAQKPVRARPLHLEGVPSFSALVRGVGAMAVNRSLLLLAVINISVMAIVVGILAWTPAFLEDQRGSTLAVAAYLTAGVGVAQIIGNVVGALAMARWGKPFVLFTATAVMFVATALVPAVPGFALVIVCVVVAGFLTMVLFPAIFGSVPDIVARREQVGSATGFVNLTSVFGTLLAPWLFGVLLDAYGTAKGSHGYLWGYLLLALFPFLGTIAGILYMATRRKVASLAAERENPVEAGPLLDAAAEPAVSSIRVPQEP